MNYRDRVVGTQVGAGLRDDGCARRPRRGLSPSIVRTMGMGKCLSCLHAAVAGARRGLVAFSLVCGALAWAWSGKAAAQTIQVTGPLAGAPAVRHMRVRRAKKLQLQPSVGFTLQDEFSKAILFGGQLNYHFTDWLGLGVWGSYAGVNLDTDLTREVGDLGQTTDRNALNLPSRAGFDDQVGRINWTAALQATFIPLRGKLSLFQKFFVDTDFYLFGGLAFVGVEERADVNTEGSTPVCSEAPPAGADRSDPCVASQFARSSRVALAPTFGVGLMFYLNHFMGLSLEWRGLPFKWNTSGTDEKGTADGFPDGQIDSSDRLSHFNHMMSVGLAFTIPPKEVVTE